MDQQNDYYGSLLAEITTKLRDIEEKQRLTKDHLMIIGKNLIETKEKGQREIIELKKEIEQLKQDAERIKGFLETISSEFGKFARKEDVEILAKQARMFQPLLK